MKGLLTKEFIMLKKSWFVILLFVLVFGILGIFSGFPSMMLVVPLFMAVYQSNFTADEMCKWQQYAISLPYGRKNIISSKYLYTAILSLCSALFNSICYTISAVIGKIEFSGEGFLTFILCSLVTGLFYPVIVLPLSYKFSSEKGRIILMFINGCCGGLFAMFAANGLVFDSLVKLVNVAELMPFIMLGAVIASYLISWQISIKIYERRDL